MTSFCSISAAKKVLVELYGSEIFDEIQVYFKKMDWNFEDDFLTSRMKFAIRSATTRRHEYRKYFHQMHKRLRYKPIKLMSTKEEYFVAQLAFKMYIPYTIEQLQRARTTQVIPPSIKMPSKEVLEAAKYFESIFDLADLHTLKSKDVFRRVLAVQLMYKTCELGSATIQLVKCFHADLTETIDACVHRIALGDAPIECSTIAVACSELRFLSESVLNFESKVHSCTLDGLTASCTDTCDSEEYVPSESESEFDSEA